jgi:hypothetical protein
MAKQPKTAADKLGERILEQDSVLGRAEFVGGFVGGDFAATDFTVGNATEAVADPEKPTIGRRARAIPQGPVLVPVRPGDLIAAQSINNLISAIENLRTRVGDIEALIEDSRSNEMEAAAR